MTDDHQSDQQQFWNSELVLHLSIAIPVTMRGKQGRTIVDTTWQYAKDTALYVNYVQVYAVSHNIKAG